jgi:hypothetical protein
LFFLASASNSNILAYFILSKFSLVFSSSACFSLFEILYFGLSSLSIFALPIKAISILAFFPFKVDKLDFSFALLF